MFQKVLLCDVARLVIWKILDFLSIAEEFIIEVDYSGTTVPCSVMVSLIPKPSFHPWNVDIQLTKPG